MKTLGRWFCYLLTMGLLLAPVDVFAQIQTHQRGLTRRELKPKGQMLGERYGTRAKLRELRLQDSRRPRDIQAAPVPTNDPGHARPNPLLKLNANREKLSVLGGTGAMLRTRSQQGTSDSGTMSWASGAVDIGMGIQTDGINMMDSPIDVTKKEESAVEWWEMNERSRTQRGGGFRTRFGSRQPAEMMQGGASGDGTGGTSNVGPPGGGGFRPSPGQNMPPGGGGGDMGGMQATDGMR